MVAIDTGTFVSALMLRHSVPAKAVAKALIEYRVVFSHEALEELTEVLGRSKFSRFFSDEERFSLLALLDRRAFLVRNTFPVKLCRDAKDDKFLSLVQAATADFLITGDNDLLELDPFQSTRIVKAAAFLAL